MSAIVLLAGCAKENKDAAVQISSSTPINISVTQDLTKSQWLDGEVFAWSDGDKDYFGIVTAAGNYAQSTAIETDDNGYGTVTVAPTASEGDKMVLYYPYLSWKSVPTVSDSKASVNMYIGSSQSQWTGGQNYWLNDKIILGGKNVLEYGDETTYSTKMVALSSLAHFVIYSTSGISDKIQSVKFEAKSASTPLCGNVTETIYFDGTAPVIGAGDGGNTVSVSVQSNDAGEIQTFAPGTSKESTGCSFLMGLLPSTVTGFTITVTTSEDKKYVFESDKEIEFKASYIKNINLNLDNATSTVTPGDEETVWEGSHALSDTSTPTKWGKSLEDLTWNADYIDYSTLKVGDKITIYFTPIDTSDGLWTCLKIVAAKDWSIILPCVGEQQNPSFTDTSYSFTLTQEDLDLLYYPEYDTDGTTVKWYNNAGFAVQGCNLTITKITLTRNNS